MTDAFEFRIRRGAVQRVLSTAELGSMPAVVEEGIESYRKMKLLRDVDTLISRKRDVASGLREVRDELELRKKMLEDLVVLAALSRPLPEPEGRALLRRLDELIRRGRR